LTGITEGISYSGLEGETVIKQIPTITLRTLLASLGIEAGIFVTFTPQKKYQVIVKEGSLISNINLKKVLDSTMNNNQPTIMNHISLSYIFLYLRKFNYFG